MTRFLAVTLFALLAACGGGGGGTDAPAPGTPTTPPPVSHASVAGVFSADRSTVQVHSDGAVVGQLYAALGNRPGFSPRAVEHITFSGARSTGEITYTYVVGEFMDDGSIGAIQSTQQGTGTVEISAASANGAPALTVHFPLPNVPFMTRTLTLAKKPLPDVYIGLPLEKLGGWLQFGIQRDGQTVWGVPVYFDLATGVINGSFGPQCHIAGKLYGYDMSTGTMRQDWTLVGNGCPIAGTSQMVGQLLPGAVLGSEVAGLIDGKWTVITLSHPLPVLPAPFGVIAGRYSLPYEAERSAEFWLHPDGTMTMHLGRKSGPYLLDSHSATFHGKLDGAGPTYRAVGEFAVTTYFWDPAQPRSLASGTATVEITPSTVGNRLAASVRVSSTLGSPLSEFVVEKASSWGMELPFERLTGLYSSGIVAAPGGTECTSSDCSYPVSAHVQLDTTGNLSGTFGNCQLSGRITAYDPAFSMFRHDVTLQGSACLTKGSAQMLGHAGYSGHSALALTSRGILGGRPMVLYLVKPASPP